MQTKTTNPGAESLTRALLACGVIAGPLYVGIALIQAFTREGFQITRHDVSLLSNGDLGWIQITNFLVAGLLVIAGAVGMQRKLRSNPGKNWGPLFIGVYGLGLIGAGIFVADPSLGFPPGMPADAATISWHGMLHFVLGGVGFLALIAACFVFTRQFAATGQWGWAVYSMATGGLFFAAFFGIASGSGQTWSVIGFWIGVVLAWTWISTMALRLMPRVPNAKGYQALGKESHIQSLDREVEG